MTGDSFNDCIASHVREIQKWWIGEDTERKGRGLIITPYVLFLWGLRKVTNSFIHDNQ